MLYFLTCLMRMLLMGIYSSLIVYLRQAIVKKQSYNRSKIKISLFAQLRLNLGLLLLLLLLLFSLDDLGPFFNIDQHGTYF